MVSKQVVLVYKMTYHIIYTTVKGGLKTHGKWYSYDPDGDKLTYSWSVPPGGAAYGYVAKIDPIPPLPPTPPCQTNLIIFADKHKRESSSTIVEYKLIVNDGKTNSKPDYATVTICRKKSIIDKEGKCDYNKIDVRATSAGSSSSLPIPFLTPHLFIVITKGTDDTFADAEIRGGPSPGPLKDAKVFVQLGRTVRELGLASKRAFSYSSERKGCTCW